VSDVSLTLLQIWNIEVFLESTNVALACNKTKTFLLPETDNTRHSKIAIDWLLLAKEGKTILHGRKGKERQLSELPDIRVDGLCDDTRTVYGFIGC